MRDRFDQNEVNPLPPSTNNNKLCYCKVLFSWLGGGGRREGVMLWFSDVILKLWGGSILFFEFDI